MAEIEPGSRWREYLEGEFERTYMKNLKDFLKTRLNQGKIIYPHGKEIFNAFKLTPFEKVKVVIIGQDPYHGPGQAHGLCFSVKPGTRVPPSLVNIFREVHSDLGIPVSQHGYLKSWAQQGVLLLNTVLTVEKGRAGSHQGQGWECFTDKVIDILSSKKEHLVFMLWGSHAQRKAASVDTHKHCLLKCPHPSPLSAHRGFFGSKHFRRANDYLAEHQKEPIDWELPQ